MEAQRILCMAASLTPGVLTLQREAEQAGMRFQVIAGAHQVVAAVTALDDLLIMADGLMVDPSQAAALLGRGHAVLVQPVEAGLAMGFERIDINHASAGLLRIPGRLAERLGDLPADCDAVSALTRIALQAGVPQVPVPAALREGPGWQLVRSEDDAHGLEARLIDRLLGPGRGLAPGFAITRQAVRSFGPALLEAGSRETVLAAISALIFALGLVAGWLGYPAVALVMFGIAWSARRTARLTGAIARSHAVIAGAVLPREKLFGMMLDLGLAAVVVWAGPGILPWWERAFAPVALIGALRGFRRWLGPVWKPWLGDRLLLCGVLAAAAGLGLLRPAVMALAIGVMAAGLLVRPGSKGPDGAQGLAGEG